MQDALYNIVQRIVIAVGQINCQTRASQLTQGLIVFDYVSVLDKSIN